MVVQLSQQDVLDLKRQGFKEDEISKAVNELEREDMQDAYGQSRQGFQDPRNNASHSSFGSKASDDIARWQLELNDILEKAEHTLKGDIVVFKDGQSYWERNPHPEDNTLNDSGVQICMKFLSLYVNRNTILADFTAEEIGFKVLDFGKRFNNLIFKKYEEMGMDTEDKRKEYDSIVGAMVDVVHSAYARAKDGRERESYRKMISVNQASGGMMGGGLTVNTQGQQKTRGLLNPMRYIAGKYS